MKAENANEERALAFFIFVVVVVLLIVLADEVSPGSAVVRRGRWGGLGEEGKAEGGGGGELLTGGAAAGAMSGADGLEHATLPLLQHVLLWRPFGKVRRSCDTDTHEVYKIGLLISKSQPKILTRAPSGPNICKKFPMNSLDFSSHFWIRSMLFSSTFCTNSLLFSSTSRTFLFTLSTRSCRWYFFS